MLYPLAVIVLALAKANQAEFIKFDSVRIAKSSLHSYQTAQEARYVYDRIPIVLWLQFKSSLSVTVKKVISINSFFLLVLL